MLDTYFEGNPNGNDHYNQTGQFHGIMPRSRYPPAISKVIIYYKCAIVSIRSCTFKDLNCKYNASEAVMYINGWNFASCDSGICNSVNRYNNEKAIAQTVALYSPVAASIYIDE